jgi:hypothetical protein
MSSFVAGWMVLQAVALAASLFHILLDYAIGLYGKSSVIMTPLQAATVLLVCLVYAYWMLVMGLAGRASKAAPISLLLLALIWSFLVNGVIGLGVCPPPCHNAFPYQDIAHLGNVIFGGFAAYAAWRQVRASSPPVNWWLPGYTLALLLAAFAMQSVLALLNL